MYVYIIISYYILYRQRCVSNSITLQVTFNKSNPITFESFTRTSARPFSRGYVLAIFKKFYAKIETRKIKCPNTNTYSDYTYLKI